MGQFANDFIKGPGATIKRNDAYDTLAHKILETSYQEMVYSAGKLTQATYWTDNGKTIKIRQNSFTYSAGKLATSTKVQYDEDGIATQTLSSTYTYSGGVLASVDIVRT